MYLKEGQIACLQDGLVWHAITKLEGTVVKMTGKTKDDALEKIRHYVDQNKYGFEFDPE